MNLNESLIEEMPFIGHLIELRSRLIRVMMVVGIIFFSLVSFRNDLYTGLAAPLRHFLPAGSLMIATDITSSFTTPFKLTFFCRPIDFHTISTVTVMGIIDDIIGSTDVVII